MTGKICEVIGVLKSSSNNKARLQSLWRFTAKRFKPSPDLAIILKAAFLQQILSDCKMSAGSQAAMGGRGGSGGEMRGKRAHQAIGLVQHKMTNPAMQPRGGKKRKLGDKIIPPEVRCF